MTETYSIMQIKLGYNTVLMIKPVSIFIVEIQIKVSTKGNHSSLHEMVS